MDFQIAREDLHRCRHVEDAAPVPSNGQALLSVEHFGLSANNITYAKFGEAMSYWNVFPAPEGWGRMPTWGFAEVVESRADGVPEGARFYGYLPPSSELLVTPARVGAHGFVDGSPHRAELPPVYNSYANVAGDPVYDAAHEDAQMLLRPLFFTSWLIDDMLAEVDVFGAETVVLSSASSKTSSALAYLLSRREGIAVAGLTSSRSVAFTRDLGVYDLVAAYEDATEELPAGRAVFVDMAGNGAVRQAVHERYGADLTHSAVVGATHHDKLAGVPDELPGPQPVFFFAPVRVAKRSEDWGRESLEARLAESWHPYAAWAEGWMTVEPEQGPEALERVYLDVLDGRVDPATAHVISLPR